MIGLFVLAAIGAVFGFVYWLNNTGGLGERHTYRVQFDTPVPGLLAGAAVLFNGIRVGEVTQIMLPQGKPKQVLATISVAAATPVKADTKAGLDFQGLTGVPVIALEGGSEDAKPAGGDLIADPAASQSMTMAARTALVRLDALVSENSSGVRDIVGNLKTFSEALARNSGRVDGILAGVEKMTGGGPPAPPKTIYDLTAPVSFPAVKAPSEAQLAVADPTATLQLDTQRILVLPVANRPASFDDAQWGDSIPKLVQARLVQAFENFSLQRGVTRTSPDVSPEQQLLVDIRSFNIEAAGEPVAEVALSAKIVSKDGHILASKIFSGKASLKELTAATSVAAINAAFTGVASEIVVWAAGVR